MQDKDVRAFRQRLLRAGFKDVSLFCHRDDVYLRCISPQNEKIERHYKLYDVRYLPVIKYLL